MFKRNLFTAIRFLLLISLICGAYTAVITLISQAIFPFQANGSLLKSEGEIVGSRLLWQGTPNEKRLFGRADALPIDENGTILKAPSNLSPVSEAYATLTAKKSDFIRKAHPDQTGADVPQALITGSGSGVDPEIPPEAAQWQIGRIAAACSLPQDEVAQIIAAHTSAPLWGIFGEARVNVPEVNLELSAKCR